MLESAPLVSVVLGVYNQEQYVEESIKSIFNQTYKNIEIIIINNGSTDNSGEIIEKYSAIENIYVQDYKKNCSINKVTNAAIDLASGEYICFIAGDDFYLADYIKSHLNTISTLPDSYGVVYSSPYILNVNTGERFIESNNFNKSGDVFDSLIDSIGIGYISAFTPFIRRRVFDVIRYDEDLFCEGESIFIRIAREFLFMYIEKPCVVMRDHESNQGKNYKENGKLFYVQCKRLIKLYPDKTPVFNRVISKLYIRYAWIATRIMSDKKWIAWCLKTAITHRYIIVFHPKAVAVLILYLFPSKFVHKMLSFKKNKTNDLYIEENYAEQSNEV